MTPAAAAAIISIAMVIIPLAAVLGLGPPLAPLLITMIHLLRSPLTLNLLNCIHIGLELDDALLDICFIYIM